MTNEAAQPSQWVRSLDPHSHTLAAQVAKVVNLTPVAEIVHETVNGRLVSHAFGIRPDHVIWTDGKPTLSGYPHMVLEPPKFLVGHEALAAVNAIQGRAGDGRCARRAEARANLLPAALNQMAQRDAHAHATVMLWAQGDTGPDHACLMVAAALYESKADIFRAYADHLMECGHVVNEVRARSAQGWGNL